MILFLSSILHFVSPSAQAFDPFTVAMVVSTASKALDSASEVAGTSEAFTELYSEIDSEAVVTDGGKKVIEQIQTIQSLANELDYTSTEISGLTNGGGEENRKIENQIRTVTAAIRSGKRISKLLMKLDKKAQVAAIDTSAVAQQQLANQMNLVYLEQVKALDPVKNQLKEEKRKRDEGNALKKILQKNGARYFAKTRTLAYPKLKGVLDAAMNTAKTIRPILIGFLMLAMGLRFLYKQARFQEFDPLDIVKDAVFCLLFLYFLPYLTQAILISCDSLSSGVVNAFGAHVPTVVTPDGPSIPALVSGDHTTSSFMEWIYEWVLFLAYSIADTMITLTQSFMVIVLPIAIFIGVIFKMDLLWSALLTAFTFISLWPFFWNCFGILGELIWQTDATPLKTAICGFFITFFQIISPFFIRQLMNGMHAHSAISEGAQAAASKGASVASHGRNVDSGIAKGLRGDTDSPTHGVAAAVGVGIGGAGNQLLSRAREFRAGTTGSTNKSGRGSLSQGVKGAVFNNANADSSVSSFVNGLKLRKFGDNKNA